MSQLTPISFKKGRKHEPRLSKPYIPGKHDPRYWSDDEKEIVKTWYPIGGAGACLARLPSHRGQPGVYQQARKLGVSAPLTNPTKTRPKLTEEFGTPEMDAIIRERWPFLRGKGAVADLAAELNVPRWWLSKRALKLELTMPHRKEPPWSSTEIALLRKVPLHDLNRCAKIFRDHGFQRSATAISVKAKRETLSRRATRSSLSGTEVARLLGIDNKTTTQWCITGFLPATRRGTRRLPQQGGDVWDIDPHSLKQFIIENLARIDIRKVEKFSFVDLLTRTFDESNAAVETTNEQETQNTIRRVA